MTYTLGSTTVPNATWGPYWNDLGEIQNEHGTQKAGITEVPLFGKGSDYTDGWDAGGVVKIITLEVIQTKDTITNLAIFLGALLSLQNGDQSPANGYPIDFISDISGPIVTGSATAIKVKILDIDWDWWAGGPLSLGYTIKLLECSVGIG